MKPRRRLLSHSLLSPMADLTSEAAAQILEFPPLVGCDCLGGPASDAPSCIFCVVASMCLTYFPKSSALPATVQACAALCRADWLGHALSWQHQSQAGARDEFQEYVTRDARTSLSIARQLSSTSLLCAAPCLADWFGHALPGSTYPRQGPMNFKDM